MAIRLLRPGDEALLEAFLLPQIESSMFLLGNMRAAGLADAGERYQGTYAAAVEDGAITGVAGHFWSGGLVLQAPAHLDALWRAALAASRRPVQTVAGPAAQVGAVKLGLGVVETNVQYDETEDLYSLTLAEMVEPENLRSGRVRGRRMEPWDLDLVTGWRVAYTVETLGGEETPDLWEDARASVESHLQAGTTWILEEQGRPVACSSFNSACAEAVQVGGVWTPPPLRRRGYGRAAVAASLRDARTEGVQKAILFTEQANVAAQQAYRALGFQRIGDYRLLLLRKPAAGATPFPETPGTTQQRP